MFGYIKLDSTTNRTIKRNYKRYYCVLCKALEQHYGIKSRPLLSFDITFFFILFSNDQYINQIDKITCIGKTQKMAKAIKQEIAKKIATMDILLVAIKLEDDIYDENSKKAKAIKKMYTKQINQAKENYPDMYEIIISKNKELRELEKKNASLEEIEEKFSEMMVKIATKCFNVEEQRRIAVVEMVSKWIYFIDAIDDLDEDIKEEKFNPLKKYKSFSNLKNIEYKKIGKHFHELYKKVQPVKGKENAQIINQMVYSSIPKETIKVLEREGK